MPFWRDLGKWDGDVRIRRDIPHATRHINTMAISEFQAHAAVEARDRRFDGLFFTGVTSTGIYCRCVCPAKATAT